ncbi:hypothetical protein J4456_04495 [Candidatus Pacearchaeota archaeon]|nr:hypothetical protein [Candidatus Pacearchaeota archaeon]
MGKITDMNVTNLPTGKIAANLGDAHEHLVSGILMRLGFIVGFVDIRGSPYDLFIIAFENPNGKEIVLRAQVKTIDTSISFIGGSRGGIDREYKSGVKTYKYNTSHSDIILGIDRKTLDVYLIPTRFIQKWGTSRATSKIQLLKNNWDILLNWNNVFLSNLDKQIP